MIAKELKIRWWRRLFSRKKSITIDIPNLPIGVKKLEMAFIPAGTFMMGSPESDPNRDLNETPQHRVRITKPFYMGKYEITQAQWEAVMGNNPSKWKGIDQPVEQVSWNACQKFIKKLNHLGQGTFRLPTEAEWEYACRAGSKTAFFWGNDRNLKKIERYAWYIENSGNKPHVVGIKSPNAWGLYDMSGNVWEWCQDWYGDYTPEAQTDPTGIKKGSYHVIRGGCWYYKQDILRSANREFGWTAFTNYDIGFRVVMEKK